MISPEYLKKGDRIALIAPARKVTKDELNPAIKIMQHWGLEVTLGKNIFKEYHQFSGTDAQRAEDFQMMLDDPSITAIISARGGYGNIRIIDKIDFEKFIKSPKWIVGYSDTTVLHSHIHTNFEIE